MDLPDSLAHCILSTQARQPLGAPRRCSAESLTILDPVSANHPMKPFLTLLDRVSPASRAVLLLHYQHDLSLEETAAILEIPIRHRQVSPPLRSSPAFANT